MSALRLALRPRTSSIEPIFGALVAVLVLSGHFARNSPTWVGAFDLVTCLVAGLTGRWPTRAAGALAIMALGYWLVPTNVSTLGELALLIPVLGFGMRGQPRLGLIFAVIYLAEVTIDILRCSRDLNFIGSSLVFWLCTFAAVWLIGNTFSLAREGHRAQERAAVLADRVSTARDLHDTVAHLLAVMSMRAQRAQLCGRVEPDDLDFFAETSAQSVRELRAIMSVLRSDEGASGVEAHWRLPTLPGVVADASARLGAHGFGVTVTSDGELDRVPGPTARVLERVSCEAVNNIIKHGLPGSACSILVDAGRNEIQLAFLNRISQRPRRRQPTDGPALGIEGMRERVSAVNGALDSRKSGDQWLTQVTLPMGLDLELTREQVERSVTP